MGKLCPPDASNLSKVCRAWPEGTRKLRTVGAGMVFLHRNPLIAESRVPRQREPCSREKPSLLPPSSSPQDM